MPCASSDAGAWQTSGRFFKKIRQKTFALGAKGGFNNRLSGAKVFWFFFSKKNRFLF